MHLIFQRMYTMMRAIIIMAIVVISQHLNIIEEG
jgi:hypothetical protein